MKKENLKEIAFLSKLIDARSSQLANISVRGLGRFLKHAAKARITGGGYNYKRSYMRSFRDHMLAQPIRNKKEEKQRAMVWRKLEEMYE